MSRASVAAGRGGGARVLAAAGMLAAALALVAVPPSRAGEAASGASPLTKSGSGAFAGLKVTVSQTQDLVSQTVTVAASGGVPTRPSTSSYAINYLQVMQCWGDDASGPLREQCQFGGLFGASTAGGAHTSSRQLTEAGIADPNETIKPMDGKPASVPFRSVSGETATGPGGNKFFDRNTTNELPYVRVRADGTSLDYLEVQTAAQAPGLGCGAVATGSSAPRSCWLVVVPRGDTEVDGSKRTISSTNQLQTSPLSQTNWDQRIVFPLSFQPVGRACSLGVAERRTVGQEIFSEAITRWQPTLCAAGPSYGYSATSDEIARRQLVSPQPGMVFLSRPLGDDVEDPTRPTVYAPVALSALTVAFNIDSVAGFKASADVKNRDGQRLTEVNLTPRLMAKLLTQSYRTGVNNAADSVAKNPLNLTVDPDFLASNPAFADLRYGALGDVITSLGQTDATYALWQYVLSDAEGRDFIAGKPDPYGMTINPNYVNLELPREDFPKNDPFCHPATSSPGAPDKCTLDDHPYSNSLHDAAVAGSRGDTLFSTYDATQNPPRFVKDPPPLTGSRAVAVITDAASAARYGLPTARLRNASGTFAAPGAESELAGAAAATPSSRPEVRTLDPAKATGASYPLTTITYAATAPAVLEPAAGKDYAALLRYAAGPGQSPGVQPGQLPDGYTPLPDSLRAQTRQVADTVESTAGKPVAAAATPADEGATAAVASAAAAPARGVSAAASAAPARTRTGTAATVAATAPRRATSASAPAPVAGATSASSAAAGLGATSASPPAPGQAVSSPVTVPAPRAALPLTNAARTQGTSVGSVKWVLVGVLVLGAAALLTGVGPRVTGRASATP